MTDGLVDILNGSGEMVAQEGTEVVLHGGAIPHSWDSEQYRQHYYNIPWDCYGPYWIVGELITPIPAGTTSTPMPWIDIKYPPDTRTGIAEIDLYC